MDWVALLALVIIIGALFGGEGLGGTIRTGCGMLVVFIIIVVILAAINGG